MTVLNHAQWDSASILAKRFLRSIFGSSLPIRLSFGAYWVARKDNLSEPLLAGIFETAELAFVERFLQPGMTVLDLGAHQGLYTLLASKRVGPTGRVISFEPSPRERRALRLHVWLNLCRNVTIEGMAVGEREGAATLYVVEDAIAGCNSLRPPAVASEISPVCVDVTQLDGWLENHGIERVHFIKLDVEGAELDALKGATRLLERRPRPVVLAEVQDIRTEPWGYRAREIIDMLSSKGYMWFRLNGGGFTEELDLTGEYFEGNFVAYPMEWKGPRPQISEVALVR
jgi:FkbM family methyltransferase